MSDPLVDQVNLALVESAIVASTRAALSQEQNAERALRKALAVAIHLTRESVSPVVAGYFNFLLSEFTPLALGFDAEDKLELNPAEPGSEIMRWRRQDGQIETLINSAYWQPRCQARSLALGRGLAGLDDTSDGR